MTAEEEFLNRVHNGLDFYNFTNLEDVESLHDFYREKMLECNSLTEMKNVCIDFGWLAGDARAALDLCAEDDVEKIKLWLSDGLNHKRENENLYPIVIPHYMLWAYIVGKKYQLPEYWAAVQYVRAFYFNEKDRYRYD